MKVVIVNCFDTYEERVDLVHEFFKEQGYSVTVIQSDFRHFKKVNREDSKEGFIFVKSKPYFKNLSAARLFSHYKYACDAFEIVEKIQPDLLYTLLPPNSLAKFAAKYKQSHEKVKLILDIIDLWPETMPIGTVENLPPFYFWGAIRNNSFKYADSVIMECDLYQMILEKYLKNVKTTTIQLAKKEVNIVKKPILSKNEIHLCYLGSINNIIDIPKITSLVKSINEIKPVIVHIIGDGESKVKFIDEIKSTGANVKYYGKVYEYQKKQIIFDKCQFGLNIMKDTVCVGLTMKSIDYFQAGLPVINSIKADTAKIVEKYNIGANVIGENISEVASKVASFDIDELFVMRENTSKVYESLFSQSTFNTNLKKIVLEL